MMSEEKKRFEVIDNDFSMWIVDTTLKEDRHEGNIYTAYEMCDKLNELCEENERLKQQLLYDGDDVCDICKHEYLVPWDNYFISKCKKGHEECSKEDIEYCEDFESKGVYDDR